MTRTVEFERQASGDICGILPRHHDTSRQGASRYRAEMSQQATAIADLSLPVHVQHVCARQSPLPIATRPLCWQFSGVELELTQSGNGLHETEGLTRVDLQ